MRAIPRFPSSSEWIELRRRQIIQTSRKPSKETQLTSGSGTNTLEKYMLTVICPPTCITKPCTIYDGGNSSSEFSVILDGNGDGIILDAANVCD